MLDFGIARLNWGEQSMATAAGLIFGTARYISPEGAQGEQVGPEGDVYSIATMLYQMLAGRTPFDGDSGRGAPRAADPRSPAALRSIPRASYVPEPIATSSCATSPRRGPSAADARELGRALLDAAVASGLSADDLLAHPTILGARSAAPLRVESKQRTRALLLDVETQERLANSAPPHESGSRLPSARPAHGSARPAPSATTKWTPPPGFQERLAAAQLSPSVDPTLDEVPVPLVSPVGGASAPPITLSDVSPIPAARISEPAPRAESVPPARVSSSMATAATRSDPEDDEPLRVARGRGRIIMVVLMTCFTLGVIGAVVAYKLGVFGLSRDKVVHDSWDALMHQRWDTPPGDNVKDITNEGLQDFPNDPQLLSVRELACDEIVKVARAKKNEGDIMEALRLLKLGNQLDPRDEDAQRLLGEYQKELEKAHLAPPPAPQTATTGSALGVSPHSSTSASASAPVPSAVPPSHTDLVLETPVTVRVGLGADFMGHILVVPSNAARPRVDGATFVVVGPGLGGGTHLPAASDEAGAFRAHYVFSAPGHYEVAFALKANGMGLRASRSVTVVAAEAPAPPPTVTAPPPATTTATEPDPPPRATTDDPPAHAARPDGGTSGWL